MDFYDIIRESHSGIRWLVVIVWVVVVLRYLLAWLTNPNKYLSFDRIIYSVFTGLLDLECSARSDFAGAQTDRRHITSHPLVSHGTAAVCGCRCPSRQSTDESIA